MKAIRYNQILKTVREWQQYNAPLSPAIYMALIHELLQNIKPETIDLTTELRIELERLIRSGNRIEAIKKYRAVSGESLYESKNFIDQMTEQMKTCAQIKIWSAKAVELDKMQVGLGIKPPARKKPRLRHRQAPGKKRSHKNAGLPF